MNILTLGIGMLCACWIVALPFLLFFIVRNMAIIARELKEMRKQDNVR